MLWKYLENRRKIRKIQIQMFWDGGNGSFVNKAKFKTPVWKLKIFSFYMASNEKLLNTKLTRNFEIYNFRFRQKFIWGFVWNIKFETWVHLKRSYTLRNSKFSPIFVWRLEKLWTRKLFVIRKLIILVLGKNPFKQRFKIYFENLFVTIWKII